MGSNVPSRYRPLLLNLALIAAYILLGRAGLLLAVPPGYATAIFPPAGLAIGAVFIFGMSTLPAALIGSFLLNLWVGDSVTLPIAAWSAAIIAVGSGLQAAIGGQVLRRVVSYPTPLDNFADIARFVLVAPAICLVSPTFSLCGLYLIGTVSAVDISTSWTTWWIGDTLGALIAVPLLLAATGEPRALWRRRARSLALPMLLFFGLFVAIFVQESAWEREQTLSDFRLESQKLSDDLRSSLDGLGIVLEQLKAGFASRRTTISRGNFGLLTSVLLRSFPTVQAVEWAPRITDPNRWQQLAASEGIDGPLIREHDTGDGLRVAGRRPAYFPVTFIEPLAGNERALGFDLASDRSRREAITEAFVKGRVTATAPVRLVQARGDSSGILVIEGVSSGPTGPGVLVIVLRMSRFVQAAARPMSSDLVVRVVDVAAAVPLFASLPQAVSPQLTRSFTFGGRRYAILTAPTQAYLVRHRSLQSWLLLVAGILCTALLGALLMLGTGQSWRFESLLAQRTQELQRSHDRLMSEIAEREQAQMALHHAKRMQTIGQLTGGVAHDFNNLLMVVTGSVERLRKEAGGSATKYLDMIRAAAHRGQGLVSQLLSFAQLRILRPRVIDVCAATRNTAEMIRLSLRGDIEVRVTVPDEVCAVSLDSAEYELTLLNLAVNARDAMPKGGVLSIAIERVMIKPPVDGLEGHCVAVTLIDTGAGIAPDILPRVFEPYFTTKTMGTGTGLGLSQVYGFAKQSAGTVTISSTPGQGTRVTLLFPESAEQPILSAGPLRSAAAAPRGILRALVVEDNEDIARVLAMQLTDLGYRVETAANGEGALNRIASDSSFAIVISDILMPGGMSGLELARRLRAQTASIPVLLITGYSGSEIDPAGEGFAVLRKPFETTALADALATLLGHKAWDRSIT